jgi:hypothetical protein
MEAHSFCLRDERNLLCASLDPQNNMHASTAVVRLPSLLL